jgi:hypothetical protein
LQLNILVLDVRGIKSSFYLNGGLTYYKTPLRDTTENISYEIPKNLHTLVYNAQLMWDIKPDPRYGISMAYQLGRLKPQNKALKIYDDVSDYVPESKRSHYFHTFEFNAEFRPNQDEKSKNRIFFRGRYSYLSETRSNPYVQIQVGYSFYLFKK